MSSPLLKISDESWSLVCLCCSCAQEVRDVIKMTVGAAFVEYNHRFTCPHCQTYNQILLTRSMFDQAQVMVFQATPPAPGGQNAPPFDPNEFSNFNDAPSEGSEQKSAFSFDFGVGQSSSSSSSTNPSPIPETYKPSVPSFEATSQESKTVPIPKSSAPVVKPPVKKPSKKDDDEIDGDLNAEDLLNQAKGKGKAEKTNVQEKAASGTINVFGKEIPLNNQTKLIAGGGVILIVFVIGFLLFRGGSKPVQTANASPTPTASASATPKKTPTPTPTPTYAEPKFPVIEQKMIEIPGGEYTIGSNDGKETEKPAHKVTVKAFLIDNCEVTKQDYAKFLKETNHKAPESWVNNTYKGSPLEPVAEVSWEDAQAYAKWAGKRLPTEIEWEIAAGGKDHLRYPWGNDWELGRANTQESAQDGPKPAGAFAKGVSPFGLYDTSGNVWEWTDSIPEPYPGSSLKVDNAKDYRIIKGGSHKDVKGICTTYGRNWVEATKTAPILGFRCAKDK
jgi:formylglycine-generating enzyme required for sulfatase activity